MRATEGPRKMAVWETLKPRVNPWLSLTLEQEPEFQAEWESGIRNRNLFSIGNEIYQFLF